LAKSRIPLFFPVFLQCHCALLRVARELLEQFSLVVLLAQTELSLDSLVDPNPQNVILNERFLCILDEVFVGFGVVERFLIGSWIIQVLDEIPEDFAHWVLLL
jgi:hypothetical protein